MKNIIAVDLGGTSIKFGIVNEKGELLYEGLRPTMAESSKKVINNLKVAISDCIDESKSKNIDLVAIGIGTPGIVDPTYRIVLGGADNIEGWVNINLSDELENEFHIPVYINNDANMMGLGEQWHGVASDSSDVVFLTIGTGIGGAIIIDGNLYGGFANRGTELGHIPLIMDGRSCSCGSVGCLEAYASTSALVDEYSQLIGTDYDNEINGKLIVEEYQKGSKVAIIALNHHFQYVGRGIAGLVNIFSPQKVVIGGGISESGTNYIDNITKEYHKYVMPDCAVNTEICAAQLGNKAGLFGAAKWALIQESRI